MLTFQQYTLSSNIWQTKFNCIINLTFSIFVDFPLENQRTKTKLHSWGGKTWGWNKLSTLDTVSTLSNFLPYNCLPYILILFCFDLFSFPHVAGKSSQRKKTKTVCIAKEAQGWRFKNWMCNLQRHRGQWKSCQVCWILVSDFKGIKVPCSSFSHHGGKKT